MLTTDIWPPISQEELKKQEELSAARELEWLVNSLKETISSLKAGLDECLALLEPVQPGSTLVLSTSRSESLKGYITRVGNQIVKGEIQIKMHGLPNTKGQNCFRLQIASAEEDSDRCLLLDQLIDARNFVQEAIYALPDGDDDINRDRKLPATDARWMLEHLIGIRSNVHAAKMALSKTAPSHLFPYRALDPKVFEPPLPPNLSFDLTITDAALVAELRTLDHLDPNHPSLGGTADSLTAPFSALNLFQKAPQFHLRERFASALAGTRTTGGSLEDGTVYTFRGAEVKVKEKVRVESQDPSLMSVMAKLAAIENNAMLAEKTLNIAMQAAGR